MANNQLPNGNGQNFIFNNVVHFHFQNGPIQPQQQPELEQQAAIQEAIQVEPEEELAPPVAPPVQAENVAPPVLAGAPAPPILPGSRSRMQWTDEENNLLINPFLTGVEAWNRRGRRATWIRMEENNTVPGRTSYSMMARLMNHIIPGLEHYNLRETEDGKNIVRIVSRGRSTQGGANNSSSQHHRAG